MSRILIVVDYQNDFVSGSLGFPKACDTEKGIVEKILEYEKDEVVYTLDMHMSDYLNTQEGKKLPVEHCIKGTVGAELYGEVKNMLAGKRCFEKSTFGSGELYEYLKGGNYSRIELCGLVSNICVIANAVLAKTACPEAEIVVNPKLTASFDAKLNEAALDIMRGLQIVTEEI